MAARVEIHGQFAQLEALQDQPAPPRVCPWPSWEHRWIAQTPCRLEDPGPLLAQCLKLLDALEEPR
jgi:hypothetical protein